MKNHTGTYTLNVFPWGDREQQHRESSERRQRDADRREESIRRQIERVEEEVRFLKRIIQGDGSEDEPPA